MKLEKRFWIVMWILMVLILIFTRVFNLERTARFVWDESSDLVRIVELFKHPKLTLIGPISEDGVKVFGSLSYYMTLPFVAVFGTDPIVPVMATVFFGILTVLGMLVVMKKIKLPTMLGLVILTVSSPLIESARWAWNPHFIPFWQAAGLVGYFWGGKLGVWIAGICFGLTVHNHYYGLFGAMGMAVYVLLTSKEWRKTSIYLGGIVAALVPFLVFDLTHPPGLFTSRMIFFSPVSISGGGFQPQQIISNVINLPGQMADYLMGGNKIGGIMLLILMVPALIISIQRGKWQWLVPTGFQIAGLSLIGGNIYNHYLLPGVIFYYLWILENIKLSKWPKLIFLVIFIFNLWTLPKLLTHSDWSNNIQAIKSITKIMKDNYIKDKAEFNIAVLSSPDPNTKGRRYRDLLNIEGIPTVSPDDFNNSNRVFFVSYAKWEELIKDPSYELNKFRSKIPKSEWTIPDSSWRLYLVEN